MSESQVPDTVEFDLIATIKESWVSEKLVANLLRSLTGSKPSLGAWAAWFQFGRPPFAKDKGRIKVDSTRIDWRAGGGYPEKLKLTKASVDAARHKVADAKAKLEAAQADLDQHEAEEAAILQHQITAHILTQIHDVMMFGPAYEILRIIGPQLPLGQRDTGPGSMSRLRSEAEEARRAESLEILQGVDRFAGNDSFDEELRNAIKAICQRYRSSAPQGRYRPREQMRKSVRDEANFDPRSLVETYAQLEKDEADTLQQNQIKTDALKAIDATILEIINWWRSPNFATDQDTLYRSIAKMLDQVIPREDGRSRADVWYPPALESDVHF